MSSDTIARVLPYYNKACELEDRGHLLRASENFGRAAEAACSLGPDNLITLEMQRSQAVTLHTHAATASNTTAAVDPLAVAAHRADAVALLSAAVAALERRRVAGTLLAGKCTAAEEACYAAINQTRNSPDAWRAPLAGYDGYVRVANTATLVLSYAWVFAGACSAAQLQSFTQHVVHAAELMQLPRSHSTIAMNSEVFFTDRFSDAVENWFDACGLEARLVQLLTGAWQRLKQSGVLEARGIIGERVHSNLCASHDEHVAAVRAAMSAPGLRTCALAGCGAKEAHPQHFKSCAACRTVVYCCRENQVEGWPSHKKACKAACKAKAEAADGGAGPGAAS